MFIDYRYPSHMCVYAHLVYICSVLYQTDFLFLNRLALWTVAVTTGLKASKSKKGSVSRHDVLVPARSFSFHLVSGLSSSIPSI